jgi:hypothetical protein
MPVIVEIKVAPTIGERVVEINVPRYISQTQNLYASLFCNARQLSGRFGWHGW